MSAPADSPYAPPPEPAGGEVRAADGTRVHYTAWLAEAPRAAVLLSHGLGEHGGRYAAFAADLIPRGISVLAVDHRGHGKSGGQRGHVGAFGSFVDDFERFRRRAGSALPEGTPLFVLGHSLGGLVVLRWLQAHGGEGVRGAVLSAPLLGIAIQAPRWKVALSGVLSKVIPNLPFSNELDPAQLSSDPAYVRSYREDARVHGKITPRLYTEMVAEIPRAVADAPRLRLPLLFVIPGAESDTVVDERAVEAFASSLEGDVTLRHYPGFRHEPLNEAERERVVGDVLGWMEARLP